MRKLVLVILVTCLLVTLAAAWRENVLPVKASSDIHQGDLVLTGNNVTTIEGRFDINGSIIVEENATLILRNSILNFTQVDDRQFNMTFRNPANGYPRLIVQNTTMASDHYLEVKFYGNSSGSVNMSQTFGSVRLGGYDSSVVNASDSSLFGVVGSDESIVHVFNCTVMHVWATMQSNVDISDSIIDSYVNPIAYNVNCSITALEPGFISHWNFIQDCSVAVAPFGSVPNLTLTDTHVDDWNLNLYESSNAMIFNSRLRQMRVSSSVVSIYDSLFSTIIGEESCALYIHNTTTWRLSPGDYSRVWFVNSTSDIYNIENQAEVYVSWYLSIRAVDSESTDVPSASVTAIFPNGTVADSRLTNVNGLARLILMEKMMNNTGTYPVGNYTVAAMYETHTAQESVNMTENKQFTLTLPFIIPEFPLFLILPIFMIPTLLTVIVFYIRKSSLATSSNRT